MTKKFLANQFLQGAETMDDLQNELIRGSTVRKPKPESKYNQSPLELVHLAKILPNQFDDVKKHYLCVIMLNQSDRPTFHIVHCSKGTNSELREVNYVFISNIGQLKLVLQAKALELIDL